MTADTPSRSELNRELNEREIAEGKIVLESLPRSLDVTLTTACNLACRMCDVITRKWKISDRVFSEIVELLPTLHHANWQGGEAFAYPRFRELLDEAHRYPGLMQTIYTNALILDDGWLRELIKGPKHFVFSIDGTDAETYERIRVRGQFDRLLEKIELVHRWARRSAFPWKYTLNAVIMRSNYRRVDEFIPFARRLGVDKLELSPVAGELGGENIFHPADPEALAFLAGRRTALEDQAREHGVRLFNRLPYPGMLCDKDPSENRTPELYCTLPWTFMFVIPGGRVLPHPHCKEPVGSVEELSLREIWNGPGMQNYRRRLLEGDYHDLCRNRHQWYDLLWRDAPAPSWLRAG